MKRGEIWLINLDPTIGAEIRKTRPAVIVNDDRMGILPLKVIVPLTDWKDRYQFAPWMVRINPTNSNKIQKVSAADAFQVRALSERRFVRHIGQMDESTMQQISQALSIVLSISS